MVKAVSIALNSKGIADMKRRSAGNPNADSGCKEKRCQEFCTNNVYTTGPKWKRLRRQAQNGAMFLNEGASLKARRTWEKQVKWFSKTRDWLMSDLTIDQLVDSSCRNQLSGGAVMDLRSKRALSHWYGGNLGSAA